MRRMLLLLPWLCAAENPEPKMIPNPEHGGDVYAYDFAAVGFELWTVNKDTIFDNVLVTDDLDYAKSFGSSTWGKIKDGEKDAKEAFEKKNAPAADETAAPASEEEAGKDDL